MTKEELQTRIDKKNKDIEKILKRIAKWTAGMNPDAISVCANCELVYDDPKRPEAFKAFKAYQDTHRDDPTVFRQDWDYNKGPNLDEAYRAYCDLAEAKATLGKYTVQMDKLVNFENEEKIEAIWQFLLDWKELAYRWYHDQAKRFFELKVGFNKALADWERANPEHTRWDERAFHARYWEGIDNFTQDIVTIKHRYEGYEYVPDSYVVDDAKLLKALDAEVRAKYEKLIQEITHITGEITDASNLSVGGKGEINGTVVGVNGTAKVLTFMAGIYHIVQRPHYRTTVRKVA